MKKKILQDLQSDIRTLCVNCSVVFLCDAGRNVVLRSKQHCGTQTAQERVFKFQAKSSKSASNSPALTKDTVSAWTRQLREGKNIFSMATMNNLPETRTMRRIKADHQTDKKENTLKISPSSKELTGVSSELSTSKYFEMGKQTIRKSEAANILVQQSSVETITDKVENCKTPVMKDKITFNFSKTPNEIAADKVKNCETPIMTDKPTFNFINTKDKDTAEPRHKPLLYISPETPTS